MQETTPKEQIPTNKNKPEKHNSKKLSSQKFTISIIMTMENKNKSLQTNFKVCMAKFREL